MQTESGPRYLDLVGDPPNPRDAATTALVTPEVLASLIAAIEVGTSPVEAAVPLAEAFFDQVDRYFRQKLGPLPWVHHTLDGRVLSVQAGTCTVAVAGLTDPVTGVLYGRMKPAVGDVYPVHFPVALPPEGQPLAPGPVPFGSPWIKVPGEGAWLYYQVGTTLHRVDWPPALAPAPVIWANHLTHAIPTLTVSSAGVAFQGGGTYVGPLVPPDRGLSIYFTWLSESFTSYCTAPSASGDTAERAALDHAGVETDATGGPRPTYYPLDPHGWAGSSNGSEAVVGFHDVLHDYQWPVRQNFIDDPVIHLFSLFCGPAEYPMYRCTQHIGPLPLSQDPQHRNPELSCIADHLQLLYSPNGGRTVVPAKVIAPAYVITRYNDVQPTVDRCSPICTAGSCFLGFLTCTAWSPCKPSECVRGYNWVGTGILNSGEKFGYQIHWGIGAWTWHEGGPGGAGTDFNLWLTATYDGRPPNPLLINGLTEPPTMPPGEQTWNTPAYYELHASYGAAPPSTQQLATPALGAGFDISVAQGLAGFGLLGQTLYAYLPCRIGDGVDRNPIVYRARAARAPGTPPTAFTGWTECPINGVAAVSPDGQSVIGWYRLAEQRGLFWRYTVDAGEHWLDLPAPPSWEQASVTGLVAQG